VALFKENIPTLEANAGPLTLELGGEAKIGAKFTLRPCMTGDAGCSPGVDGTDNNQTFSPSDYVGLLRAEIDGGSIGGSLNCGTVDIPKVFTGSHEGAGPSDRGVEDADPTVTGCDASMPEDTCAETFGADQVGATIRKLDGEGAVTASCTATHYIGSSLQCLNVTATDCATNGDADCAAGEFCFDDGGNKRCASPEFTWDSGDDYEIKDSANGIAIPLEGDACSRFALTLLGEDVGVIGFKATDIEDSDELTTVTKWFGHIAADAEGLLNKLTSSKMALELLFQALRFVIEQLQAILENGAPKLDLPIVGNKLDGGAGVANCFGGVLEALDSTEALLIDADNFDKIKNVIRLGDLDGNDDGDSGLFNVLNNAGLLRDTNGVDGDPDVNDIVVDLDCGGSECDGSNTIVDLEDIRVRFLMGMGTVQNAPGCVGDADDCPPGATNVPFDLGIPGVPLGIEGSIVPSAGWQFVVDFGLSRSHGPYVAASGPGHDAGAGETEFTVGARVGLGGGAPCDGDTGIAALDNGYNGDTNACTKGTLAFLSLTLQDGDGTAGNDGPQPTELNLLTTLDITSSGGEKIGISELTSGQAGFNLSLTGGANVDTRIRAATTGTKAKLPSVLGAFHLGWQGISASIDCSSGARIELGGSPDIAFDNLYLDAGEFFSGFLKPMVSEVNKATKPFKPVIDTVRAPVPLVSDLSEMTGGPKVTLLTLMEVANGGPLPMIRNLIVLVEFLDFLNNQSDSSLLVPLGGAGENDGGSFDVDAVAARKGKQTPDKAGQLVKNPTARKDVIGAISGDVPNCFSFPFLQDATQIFGLLMGQDVTLMRFDAGKMEAKAVVGPFTYCCIPVGPVPVGVFIEGSATIKGRFAMGYDTVGLRKAFGSGGNAVDVLDGIFIDDLDASGSDVPEITLIGEVRAGAGVDIGFAAAGVDGGIRLTVDLNLDDRPEPDGKLRLDEVVNRISNPICLFEVSGRLEAFLGAWVRVGFEWFSKSWRFEILNITLLDFSAACAPPAPAPATRNSVNGNLEVNIGPESRRKRRNFNVDEEEEEVVVRQISLDGTSFSVLLMGFVDDYHNITGVIDIQGSTENDVISLEAGTIKATESACENGGGEILRLCSVSEDPCSSNADCNGGSDVCPTPEVDANGNVECTVPFTKNAVIRGGGGDDRISSGGGDDYLRGDGDNDKISGGSGNDKIAGGDGSDVLAGGHGDDVVCGRDLNGSLTDCAGAALADGDDTITGGPGSDTLGGGPGDDDINGGPGTNDGTGGGVSPDGDDTITGGPGVDILQGFYGDDTIYGDEVLTCADATSTASDGPDKIDGGPGDDHLFGGGGDDTIGGEEGNDEICGNAGMDLLEGDSGDAGPADCGDDKIFGGDDDDQLFGRYGHDLLSGDAGNDALYGNEDADDLVGGPGRDILIGGSGRDILLGDGNMLPGDGIPDSIATHDHTHPELTAGQLGPSDGILADITRGDDAAVGPIVDSCVVGLNFMVQPIEPNVACTTAADCGADQFCVHGLCALEPSPVLPAVAGQPNANSDCLFGGDESDFLFGEGGHDRIFGDAAEGECAAMFGLPHKDYVEGNSGNDEMRGGIEDDIMYGNGGDDRMFGDSGADRMFGCDLVTNNCHGESDVDTMRGGKDDDLMEGNQDGDTMFGDAGRDRMIGGSTVSGKEDGGDTMLGNTGEDIMVGDNGTIIGGVATLLDLGCGAALGGDDVMNGNSDDDDMFGGCAMDTMHGDGGDDYMEGNPGIDTMNGDDGQDDMIGGTSQGGGGVADDNDFMHGDAHQDVMVGDNAGITRPGGSSTADGTVNRVVTLFDIACSDAALSGDDTMNGNADNDDMYGGCATDTMHGNDGDDYLEGNGDGDVMYGDRGQDDLIGGTGRTTSNDDATAIDGRVDGADSIYGGDSVADLPDDYDVIMGDNATIDRPLDGSGDWMINTFNAAVVRDIRLLDVSTTASTADATTSGGDTLHGEGNDDVMFGQGGGDTMHGGTGEDDMEGNAGDDIMNGNADDDDMVGGTGPINDDPPTGVDGRLDGSDTMHGNDGFDVMAGDNAVIERTLGNDGEWLKNTFNDGTQHEPRILRDIDSPDAAIVSDGDVMFGDEKDDLMYGQGGDDEMHGNDGDDFMEGNADSDTMTGDADEDDMIGGTVQAAVGDAGDNMAGNDADDVMIGDNGTITRPLDGAGLWQDDPNTSGVIRDVVLFDVETVSTNINSVFSGGDVMTGDADEDRMFGQGGTDEMHGGADFDYMEGNHDDDTMFGDAGEDDMIGGGSANDGVISRISIGDGLLDGEDEMYGDGEGDVMAGDNARINRELDANDFWVIDPNVSDVFREVVLFDVETVGGGTIDPDTSGSDLMFGESGRDLMFGQGNTQTDDDGDGHSNEDPADGRDNDRDGRESGASAVYDCEDHADNDGDGLADGDDPDCAALIDEDGGGDEMHGGSDVDYMEGNHGSDWMFGEGDEDDMLGGSSAGDGVIGGGVPPTDLLDGDDVMAGGDEDDNMIGDNGVVERPVDGSGIWLRHMGGVFDLAVRVVTMDQSPESAGAFGNDFMQGNDGVDDMYGQLGNDVMEGNNGEDAMVGDLGQITNNVEDGSREELIESNTPFFEDVIFPAGSLHRQAELFAYETGDGAEGHDVLLGGDGRDSMHGCAGNDIMNGDGDSVAGEDPVEATDDEDHMFGGDGDDVMWGGRSHDHVWGGHGNDHLDVRPRTASEVTAPDTPEWFTYGEPDHFQGLDIVHGGWDSDAMQANIAAPGPPPADRLIDWAGGYNVFYVCPGAYGEGTITREGSPAFLEFLRDLSESDGALKPHTEGTSGFRELAYVFPRDRRFNAKPPHPDHPGHFVCDDGTVLFNAGDSGRAYRNTTKLHRGAREGDTRD